MKDLTQQQWEEAIANDKDAVIIDARRPDEWETGIIPNATMLNIMDTEYFIEDASELDKTKNYYVYCRSGVRSVKACEVLEELGFDNTNNLLGGILGWTGDTVSI